jgi:hypothetical protein
MERTNSVLNDGTTIRKQLVYQKVLVRQHNVFNAPFDSGIMDALRNKKRQVVLAMFNKKNNILMMNIFSGTVSAEYYLDFDSLEQLVCGNEEAAKELRDYLANDRRLVLEHDDKSGHILVSYLKRVT